jgi:predicted alpha/beta hydrolase family esterase
VKEVVVLHGSNDPYVPISEAEYLHQKLGWVLEIIDGGWHFNSDAGYDKFEKLLNYI